MHSQLASTSGAPAAADGPVFHDSEPAITHDTNTLSATKKKRKKKSKKAGGAKDVSNPSTNNAMMRSPSLCISRNKHWRYISSYHGPWLQLPLELLEVLLDLNMEPTAVQSLNFSATPSISLPSYTRKQRFRERGFASVSDHTPPDSPPLFTLSNLSPPQLPRIEPGVFRSIVTIRKLIDEASELAVRARSGLSAAALNSMHGNYSNSAYTNPWALTQSLGTNPLKDGTHGNGRNATMSPARVHRLRVLAVQKLAAAYRMDEIASSVVIMQGGSMFDDIADRVLKIDPNDSDAQYVHFFHEKIPSRQLAEHTSTAVLDALIASSPRQLEFFRTRGIVHTFRDEYVLAARDFTYALKEAKALRKARLLHGASAASASKIGKKKKGRGKKHTQGQAPLNGTSPVPDDSDQTDGDLLSNLHPVVLQDALEPIEMQALFLRGAACLQHAAFLIESAILVLEGINKAFATDDFELRLCAPLLGSRYGGVETGHPDGPLGERDGVKARAYRATLTKDGLRAQVLSLARKAVRDNERFLTHLGALDSPSDVFDPEDVPVRVAYAFALVSSLRPGMRTTPPTPPVCLSPLLAPPPYHPLLLEAYFALMLAQLLLGDFAGVLVNLVRAARVISALEGAFEDVRIFLPPRSIAQAEFIEILERLATSWYLGTNKHSLAAIGNGKQLACDGSMTAHTTDSPSQGPSSASTSPATPYLDPYGPSTSTALFEHSPIDSRCSTPVLNQDNTTNSSVVNGMLQERRRQLDAARLLLAPVAETIRSSTNSSKPSSPLLNIPLHGPRVEIILAWLGGVWLPELDDAVGD